MPRKAVGDAAPGGCGSRRATTALLSGGKITVKNRFDTGRLEARSDYLIAERRPLSAPSGSIEFGRNP
jgi:hypothetical protein